MSPNSVTKRATKAHFTKIKFKIYVIIQTDRHSKVYFRLRLEARIMKQSYFIVVIIQTIIFKALINSYIYIQNAKCETVRFVILFSCTLSPI